MSGQSKYTGRKIQLAKRKNLALIERTIAELRETNWCIAGCPGQMKSVLAASWYVQYISIPGHATIVIDLGGDTALYHTLRGAAEAAGKPVYLVSLDESHHSCGWDVIQNTPAYAKNPKLAVPGLAAGLRLQSGEGYPNTFWARFSAAELNKAFDSLRAAGTELPTFRQFAIELRKNAEALRGNQVSEAHLAADELLRYTQVFESVSRQLIISQAIEEGGLVYFYLPSAIDGGAARSMAALAAWNVTLEAALRSNEERDPRTIHMLIDEWAQIVSEKSSVEATLNLARKFDLQTTVILQSLHQVPDELRGVLRTNCQLALFDAYTKEEQEWLMGMSKDVNRPQQSTSTQSLGIQSTNTSRDNWEPELTRNEILDVSGTKQDFFLVLRLGTGHRNPIVATVAPAKSKAEHDKLKHMPMPSRPVQSNGAENSSTNGRVVYRDPGYEQRAAELRELLETIRAEERWRMVG